VPLTLPHSGYLITRGADVNAGDRLGWIALHYAAYKGHLESVRLLVDGWTRVEIVANNGYTALTLAATKGHSEVVRLLIEKGANLNTTTSCGRTPLFYAIENGHLKTVRLLVDMNMSVSIGRRTL
jgi:ankyrin repeat protein